MKRIFLLSLLILLVGCSSVISFDEFDEVKYLKENKDNITSVIIHKTTLGSNDCYDVDVLDAYEAITNIEIVSKPNISVTDDYLSYGFVFNDGTEKVFSFEGKYLKYKSEGYKIKNFNKVELKSEDLVECKY